MKTAKLFRSGRSQAVRLPKDFRFEGAEVSIRREGPAVVLEPIGHDWGWLDGVADQLSGDFMADGREQPDIPDRPGLDDLFR